ncbi:MAG: hypothetical protein JXB48_21255 [Candidatus Latescibacteria bacterium]|nr:hypothetical protein [Candidatus Latescibacterota bacterium]
MKTEKTAIEELARSLKITIQYNRIDGFAAACYDDNSVEEMVRTLHKKSADHSDCAEWKISPTEWRNSIRLALANRLFTDLSEIEKIRNQTEEEI